MKPAFIPTPKERRWLLDYRKSGKPFIHKARSRVPRDRLEWLAREVHEHDKRRVARYFGRRGRPFDPNRPETIPEHGLGKFEVWQGAAEDIARQPGEHDEVTHGTTMREDPDLRAAVKEVPNVLSPDQSAFMFVGDERADKRAMDEYDRYRRIPKPIICRRMVNSLNEMKVGHELGNLLMTCRMLEREGRMSRYPAGVRLLLDLARERAEAEMLRVIENGKDGRMPQEDYVDYMASMVRSTKFIQRELGKSHSKIN